MNESVVPQQINACNLFILNVVFPCMSLIFVLLNAFSLSCLMPPSTRSSSGTREPRLLKLHLRWLGILQGDRMSSACKVDIMAERMVPWP